MTSINPIYHTIHVHLTMPRIKNGDSGSWFFRLAIEKELRAAGVLSKTGGAYSRGGSIDSNFFVNNLEDGLKILGLTLEVLGLAKHAEIGVSDFETKVIRTFYPPSTKPFSRHYEWAKVK